MATQDQHDAYDAMVNPAGFGVFSDEGLISGPFYTRASAESARLVDDPDGSDGLYVAGLCEEHPDEAAVACQSCDDEEEE